MPSHYVLHRLKGAFAVVIDDNNMDDGYEYLYSFVEQTL